MNRIIENSEKQEEKTDTGSFILTEKVKKVAEFDFSIKREQVIKQAPFLAYCCLLVILIIYNTHNAEKIIRKTDKLKKEIKDLRTHYISTLSILMSESKQSTVALKLQPLGIKELKTPPFKITYNGSN